MTGDARGRLAAGKPALALETCARRLAPRTGIAGPSVGRDKTPPVSVSWFGPSGLGADRPGSEAVVQALSGLMALHGQEWGRPRRIGLEVASVAAGVLAAQGALAASIGRSRGRRVAPVHTSVLQAGLLAASHYIAAATCPTEESYLPPAGPAPGPPFQSADGRWFEIETLDPEAWKSFWYALGADGADLGGAWAHFRARYYNAACPLPAGLHQATATRTLADTAELARSLGVSLSPVRHYGEVLADSGPSTGHPVVHAVSNPSANPVTFWPAERRDFPHVSPARTAPGGRADASELPLAGIRVVEATTRMQGPLAGLLLQMLGAEVTKVEPPGGDFGRLVAPLAGDTGSFFSCFNRGKQVVEIDLAAASGRAALGDLVDAADVFLHNWRPGKAAEWGLEAADLAGRGAGLVYVEASGWGEAAGPSRLLGTDFLVQAYAGVGDGVRPQGEVAVPARITLTDFMGALNTSEGVLAGLWHREQTGQGARVGTSLLAGAMTLQGHVLEALASGSEDRRRAGRPLWGPLDEPIPTDDGTLVVTIDEGALPRLAQVCGGANEAELATSLRRGSAAGWEERILDAGIACATLAADPSPAALVDDPRLEGLFEPLAGSSWVPASPWRFGPE